MTKPVRLYMRVEHQSEICIGTAGEMSDVPRLLEEIAALFRGQSSGGLLHNQEDVVGPVGDAGSAVCWPRDRLHPHGLDDVFNVDVRRLR